MEDFYPFSTRSKPLPTQLPGFGEIQIVPSSEIPPTIHKGLFPPSTSNPSSPDYIPTPLQLVIYIKSKDLYISSTGYISTNIYPRNIPTDPSLDKTSDENKRVKAKRIPGRWRKGTRNVNTLYFNTGRPTQNYDSAQHRTSNNKHKIKGFQVYPIPLLMFEAFWTLYEPFMGKHPRGVIDFIYLDGDSTNCTLTNLAIKPPKTRQTRSLETINRRRIAFFEYGEVEISRDGWVRKSGKVYADHFQRSQRSFPKVHATDHRIRSIIHPSEFRKAYISLFGESWEGGFHPSLTIEP